MTRVRYNKRDKVRYKLVQRQSHLVRTFGMTIDEYDALLKKQKRVCAICRLPEKAKSRGGGIMELAVDHSHRTNHNRGLLCMNCNRGIGHLQESLTVLRSAIRYLTKWEK